MGDDEIELKISHKIVESEFFNDLDHYLRIKEYEIRGYGIHVVDVKPSVVYKDEQDLTHTGFVYDLTEHVFKSFVSMYHYMMTFDERQMFCFSGPKFYNDNEEDADDQATIDSDIETLIELKMGGSKYSYSHEFFIKDGDILFALSTSSEEKADKELLTYFLSPDKSLEHFLSLQNL